MALHRRTSNGSANFATSSVARAATILLVEDEQALRELISRFLTLNGYRVLPAENSVSARRLWTQHKDTIELLLTDLHLPPGASGHALARDFQDANRELRILYTSGHNVEGTTEDDSVARVNFLPKPFRPEQLLAAVRAVLADKVTP